MIIQLFHQGRQLGAFSTEQVEAMLRGGVITGDTMAWTAGLTKWKKLHEVLAPTMPPPIPQLLRSGEANERANRVDIPPVIAEIAGPYTPKRKQQASSHTRRSSRFLVVLPGVAVTAILFVLGWINWQPTQTPVANQSTLHEMDSEHQRFNTDLKRVAKSGADLDEIKQLQDSHYTKLSSMATSGFDGDGKKVYEAMKPITDQAVALRQKCQEGMQKLLAAGFVDPATMTTTEALESRTELATRFFKDTADAYFFFAGYIEKLDSTLRAAGLNKVTRDTILMKNRSKQPILNDLTYTNYQTAKYALAIVKFLGENYGHWSMEDDVCIFETQEKLDEYNQLREKLHSSLLKADNLERSFFEEQ